MRFRTGIILLTVTTGLAIASVFIPAYLIHPFKAQTKEILRVSYFLRAWGPFITGVLFIAGLFFLIRSWKAATHIIKKSSLSLLFLLTGAATWLSFQNYYQWMFRPLSDARYVRAEKAEFITGKDMVLTVTHAGDAAAYPVRLLAYHHLVHDRVGGKPVLATY